MKLSITADRIDDVITTCYHAGITPMFVGRPGIGKTETVEQAAARLSEELDEHVHVRFLHLAGMAETDVRGYLIPVDEAFPPAGWHVHPSAAGHYYNADGQVLTEQQLRASVPAKRAEFTKPEFWADVERYPRGILFLDEVLQASPEVQKAVAPLLLEGRVGENFLPSGWCVVGAGNGMDDGAGANAMLSHVTNRVCVVNVRAPEIDAWVTWAGANDVPFELIAFAKLRPALVFDGEIPDDPNTPYCTPRSLVRAGVLSKAYPGGLRAMVEDSIGKAMLAGMIGDGAAAELAAVVQMALNLPSFEDVVADPMGAKVPKELDKAYAMIFMVAMRAGQDTVAEAATYLSRFDANYALTGFVAMVRRDTKLMRCAGVSNWIMANRGILERFNKSILTALNK